MLSSIQKLADVDASPDYTAGELIDGKYRLIRPLGRGGTSTVWLAHDGGGQEVAVKLLAPKQRASFGERLLHEARAVERLAHPSIVRVFEFGRTQSGDPFVVMERLHGETLAELLQREIRVPAVTAVQWMLPIADALGAAHAAGITHRDIKPENILLTGAAPGHVKPKLLDFGSAEVADVVPQKRQPRSLTGTPQYMAPESHRGAAALDQRSDVWSFCVVLYEMLTGCLPFEGDDYRQLFTSIVERTPPSTTEYAAGDRELWELIERGLHKDPELRWASMRELGQALALWLQRRGLREDACGVPLSTSWPATQLVGSSDLDEPHVLKDFVIDRPTPHLEQPGWRASIPLQYPATLGTPTLSPAEEVTEVGQRTAAQRFRLAHRVTLALVTAALLALTALIGR